MLNKTILWKNLPNKVISEVQSHFITLNIKKGQYLYQEGQEPSGLFLVEKGMMGLVYYSEKGTEHLLRLFKSGQILGHRSLFSKEKYHASAIALENTVVNKLNKVVICDLIRKHSEIAFVVIESLAIELRRSEEKLISLTDAEVSQRVAEALYFIKEIYSEHTWTRKEIASLCGSTTATVIKTLANFEKQGVIEQKGRDILIKDKRKLLAHLNRQI
ncbi:MAG: Crp/Fnr family transcriptional regulator [Bdellovibrionaceae bacterium]|nr:Crp/Fnr family transcriptional regulator [Pseudobdellovibrionaceae bacterium]